MLGKKTAGLFSYKIVLKILLKFHEVPHTVAQLYGSFLTINLWWFFLNASIWRDFSCDFDIFSSISIDIEKNDILILKKNELRSRFFLWKNMILIWSKIVYEKDDLDLIWRSFLKWSFRGLVWTLIKCSVWSQKNCGNLKKTTL
jgi:hypothetical protein